MFDREKLEKLNVPQLRRHLIAQGIHESRTQSARKEALLHRLEFGVWPDAPVTAASTGDSLADAIAAAISGKVGGALDEDRVREIAADVMGKLADDITERARNDAELALTRLWTELEKPRAIRVELVDVDGTPTDCGLQHKTFPELMTYCDARVHVNLVGPAGSGKSRGAEEVAKALGLEFEAIPVGLMMQDTDIMGYRDANGVYRDTAFRRRYEQGGVFLFDEIDAGNAGVLTTINGAVDATAANFPDGRVAMHKDFVCIAAANTFGRGANAEYCGRQRLDGATLDRFAVLEWPYDEALELVIAGDNEWTRYVQRAREAAEVAKIRHIISPRASIKGNKLLGKGLAWEKAVESVVFKGMNADDRAAIEREMKKL